MTNTILFVLEERRGFRILKKHSQHKKYKIYKICNYIYIWMNIYEWISKYYSEYQNAYLELKLKNKNLPKYIHL